MSIADSYAQASQQAENITPVKIARLRAMDIHRGIIMILMSFCHYRDYTGGNSYENLDWNVSPVWRSESTMEFIQQAFCSVISAAGFFLLMGIGITMFVHSRRKQNWPIEKICRYLTLRGCILIILQLTLLQAFEAWTQNKIFFYAGVLLSLGVCMLFAAANLYLIAKLQASLTLKKLPLNYIIPSIEMVLIIFYIQHLVTSLYLSGNQPSLLQILFFLGGNYPSRIPLDINFTPIPWFPAVAFGMMLGQMMCDNSNKAFTFIGKLAFSFLCAWFFIRSANFLGWFNIGEYKQLLPGEIPSFASYFCISKYPPSVAYFLWAIGMNLVLLYGLQKLEINTSRIMELLQPIKVIGQCALFFFIIHWFVFYGWSFVINKPNISTNQLIGGWLLGLLTLYPLCKAYNTFKSKQPSESIWRLF